MALTGYQGFTVPDDKYHVITVATVTNSGIFDTFIAEDRYALLATGSGIDVLDLYDGVVISSGTIPGVASVAVAAEYTTASGLMYVATSGAGVYTMRYHDIKAPGSDFSSQLQQTFSTATIPALSDDEVRDICVTQGLPFRLLISTASGVDYILDQTSVYASSTRVVSSGSNSCHITRSGEGYWSTTTSGLEAVYDLNSSLGGGIITVDFVYSPTSTPSLPSNTINDLSVVGGVTNTLAIATGDGDRVISERQGSESTSPVKSLFTQEAAVSIDFGPESSYDVGKLYVLSTGIATVYSMSDNSEIGSHQSAIEIFNRFDTENTRDQALLSGTQTLIRTTAVV